MELETRSYVGPDGTRHLATRTVNYWDAFDDPERPLGATGLLTADCGVVVRRGETEAIRDCPFCAMRQGRDAGRAA